MVQIEGSIPLSNDNNIIINGRARAAQMFLLTVESSFISTFTFRSDSSRSSRSAPTGGLSYLFLFFISWLIFLFGISFH